MWDVFISHAWEDKEEIARPLANALMEAGYKVWFDEFTLTLGDSLRRSIDAGLAQSKFGVVILSPNFFVKEWPQRELDGLTAREISSGKIILPIWHKVTRTDIERYSPVLADRLGVSTTGGLDHVLQEVMRGISSTARTPIKDNKTLKPKLTLKPAGGILFIFICIILVTISYFLINPPSNSSLFEILNRVAKSTPSPTLELVFTPEVTPEITPTPDPRSSLIASAYEYIWKNPPNDFQGFQDGDIQIVNDGLLTIDGVIYRTDLLDSRSVAVNFIFRYLTANPHNACQVFLVDENRAEDLNGSGERVGALFHTNAGLMLYQCNGGYSCERAFAFGESDEKFNDFVNITIIVINDGMGVYYGDKLITTVDLPENKIAKFRSILFMEDGNTSCQYDNIRVWNLDEFQPSQ